MRISFIIGSYNPGTCGISDYVDLLSKELAKQGHSIAKLSIEAPNDFVHYSNNLPDADLYSFQFAPYAFSQNGLSGNNLFAIAHTLQNKKTQVNFHEIWIGAYPKANLKEKVRGWRQKREILKFLKIVDPNNVNATNSAALDRLIKEEIDAKYLYLPGNIPISAISQTSKQQKIKVAFFGTLYGKFPYKLLAERLTSISELLRLPIELKIIGRQRDVIGLQHLRAIARNHPFAISKTGELATNEISKELQSCSIGVSTTPYDVLGKSGATAAMLEHGLPILAYDDGDTPKNKLFVMDEFKDQVFLLTQDSTTEQIISFMQKPRKSFFDGVAYTANKMLEVFR